MVALEREFREPLPTAPSTIAADAIPLALRRRGVFAGQVLALTVIGVFALAFFASRDLPSWSERLGDGPVGLKLQTLATQWDDAMGSIGFTRPHEALRDLIRRCLDAQW
ncbi:MAG: hypothetical protein JO008_06500 [Alphaproteobacteria bacterium]|nr:hypothetical protein [Alphaproteobacteria bacterium]